jgi:ubiquinone biosynthesis protein
VAHTIEVPSEQLQATLLALLGRYPTTQARVAAVEAILKGPAGAIWRRELGKWATWLVPVEELVPDNYGYWRPLVRDAMEFVVSRLSPSRLAPKVVEQIELPEDMPAEQRLLRLIAKVPGLQKIGQVLARNRHFAPRFRRALSQLENGISDVTIEDIRAIIVRELGPLAETYRVKLEPRIFFEASVSAVVRFTWRNPETKRREQGVFKVLKPHIPVCYEEDMKILQKLAGFLARKYIADRSRFAGLGETLTEIRLFLEHEVDFRGEQRTLEIVQRVYGSAPGVRVPRLIAPLSTRVITALTHEVGVKVTDTLRDRPALRVRLAQRLAETLLALPAFARQEDAIFHGDPHAGNLLYDARKDDLVILDWALSERLTRDQRRRVALLVLMTMLRDSDGACQAIEQLRPHRAADDKEQARLVRTTVRRFLDELPYFYTPGAMDALHLLDDVAQHGIRFPASLVVFRKAAFTLDGVVQDVAGSAVSMDSLLTRYALKHWLTAGLALWSALSLGDWVALEWSALTLAPRLCWRALGTPLRWAGRVTGSQAAA